MRKLWLIILALVVVVALALMAQPTSTTQADNGPHAQGWGATPDGCAACHRIHRGVNDMLLLNEVEDLCRTCHGAGTTGSVLNVFDGTNDFDGGALRSGGFEFARIDTDDPSLPTPGATPATILTIGVLSVPNSETTQSSHSVDGSPQTIWGNGAITGASSPGMAGYDLECGSCHDPHGNGNYRILRSIPSGSAAPTPGYAILDTLYPKTQASYSTSNYFNMTFTGSASSDNILKDTSAWCSQCHTRYLATRRAPTGPADQSRVDSGDPIFKFRHTSSGVSYSSGGTPSNVTRACITCHAAHGSNATAGDYSGSVPLPGVTPAAAPPAGTNSSDSRLLKMNNRGMCQKCHNQ